MSKIISVKAYQAAQQRLEQTRHHRFWMPGLMYGTVFGMAAVSAGSRRLLQDVYQPWWLFLVPTLITATAGITLVILLMRKESKLPRGFRELVCHNCDNIPNKTAILLTGRCNECRSLMVSLPAADHTATQFDLEEFRFTWKHHSVQTAFWLIVPLSCFLAIAGLATVMQSQAFAIACMCCGIISFFAAMFILAIRQRPLETSFRCPECSTSTFDAGNRSWIIATGKCLNCRKVILKNRPPAPRVRGPSASALLNIRKNRTRRLLWAAAVVLVLQYPIMWVIARQAWWSLSGWICLILFFPWFLIPIYSEGRYAACPNCKTPEALLSMATITSGCCCHCGSCILADEPN